MIQGFTESNITAYLSTEDNRIDTAAATSKIRFLVKLINDMNGDIEYCYPSMGKGILPRYTTMTFIYNVVPDRYTGKVNLLPSGHWKYEVYEVVWIETPVVAFGNAPATETDILPVLNTNGIVKGLVTKGILNLTEKLGTEQVQYDQHESPNSPNYVWYGQDIDVWNPADEDSMIAWYKNKVGITLDSSGNVSEWIDSSVNTFNMLQSTKSKMPSYTASTGGVVFDALDFLKAGVDIKIDNEFTVAFKIKAKTYNGHILTDTTGAVLNTAVKLSDIDSLTAANSAGLGAILNTTTGNWNDAYVVITRDSSNLICLTVNGVAQNCVTISGSVEYGTLGAQQQIADNFDGSLFELQIYDSTSQALTDLINERLSNL